MASEIKREMAKKREREWVHQNMTSTQYIYRGDRLKVTWIIVQIASWFKICWAQNGLSLSKIALIIVQFLKDCIFVQFLLSKTAEQLTDLPCILMGSGIELWLGLLRNLSKVMHQQFLHHLMGQLVSVRQQHWTREWRAGQDGVRWHGDQGLGPRRRHEADRQGECRLPQREQPQVQDQVVIVEKDSSQTIIFYVSMSWFCTFFTKECIL